MEGDGTVYVKKEGKIMPWMELQLKPQNDWNEEGLEDWSEALSAFLIEKGKRIKPELQNLPGYYLIALGEDKEHGELVISSIERIVVLLGLSFESQTEKEFAGFVARFAQQMGAVALRVPVSCPKDKKFWEHMGASFQPDPSYLKEKIHREKVDVEPLFRYSLQVTYKGKPALCLEPIFCTARSTEVVSLAQRRVEKRLGGHPIGFASRVSAYCPWELSQTQWDDLLSFSRLKCFEILEQRFNETDKIP